MAWLMKGFAWLLLGIVVLAALWFVGFDLFWFIPGVALAGFSFYRSGKAFVEYWRSLLSKKVEVEVVAEKSTYLPGETVNVTVKIRGKEDLGIQEGRVALLYENRYTYRYRSHSSGPGHSGSTIRSKTTTDEVFVATERFLEEGTIAPRSFSEHGAAFEMPPTVPPTARGEITNVDWKIRVTLGIRGAPDVIKDLPINVLSTIGSYANWAESAPELDSSGVCEMEFQIPARSFRVGERIEGTLVVTPQQDFEARALRVELVRREIVPRGAGNTSETVPASVVVEENPRFQTGSSREYAFAMDVPETAGPCLKTEQTYVGWWLRAAVDREMALDYELKQLLNVYNGPAARTACPNCGAEIPQGADLCTGCGEVVPREEAPVLARPDVPSGTVPDRQTYATLETPQQPVSVPPSLPPSGPNRAQRGLALGIFGVVGGIILLMFLAVGAVFVLFILLFILAALQ